MNIKNCTTLQSHDNSYIANASITSLKIGHDHLAAFNKEAAEDLEGSFLFIVCRQSKTGIEHDICLGHEDPERMMFIQIKYSKLDLNKVLYDSAWDVPITFEPTTGK